MRIKEKQPSVEAKAQEFWVNFYRQQKNVHKVIMQKIVKSPNYPADLGVCHREYEEAKKNLPNNLPVGDVRELYLHHKFLVKPYLPWDAIRNCLSDFRINENKMRLLIFALKPIAIEDELPTREPISTGEIDIVKAMNDAPEEVCGELNKFIKQMSPLVEKLERLTKYPSYAEYKPLLHTIERIRYDISLSRAAVKRRRETQKKYLMIFGIDKGVGISPQKHKYWNETVSAAMKILNPYSHTDNCEPGCRKTHQKTVTAVAKLLKILYPSIWKEDVKTVAARIKQKEYRNIPV